MNQLHSWRLNFKYILLSYVLFILPDPKRLHPWLKRDVPGCPAVVPDTVGWAPKRPEDEVFTPKPPNVGLGWAKLDTPELAPKSGVLVPALKPTQ
jgi:hypothetical protein